MTDTRSGSAPAGQMDEEAFREIKLTVSDREFGGSRLSTLDEAKTWDWKNPEVWRVIGGWQITSYTGLLDVLSLKMEKGHKEVEILVAPRFMMLAGG